MAGTRLLLTPHGMGHMGRGYLCSKASMILTLLRARALPLPAPLILAHLHFCSELVGLKSQALYLRREASAVTP